MTVQDYLTQLVSFDTTSSTNLAEHHSNEPLIDYLRDFFLAHNYVTGKFKVTAGNFNLIALSPSLLKNTSSLSTSGLAGSAGLGILLSGHTDCVAFNPERWQSDPLTVTTRDGKLYGRGTSDMKGFLACMLTLADHLKTSHQDDLEAYPAVSFLFTADEECSMCGAQHFVQVCQPEEKGLDPLGSTPDFGTNFDADLDTGTWQAASSVQTFLGYTDPQLKERALQLLRRPHKFDFIQIGEATSMQPVIAHKGWLAREIEIMGYGGHSSQPDNGLNAIELCSKLLYNLSLLQESLREDYPDYRFSVPYPTLNLGQINGGQGTNSICDLVTVKFDLRPTPNLSLKQVNKMLGEAVKDSNNYAYLEHSRNCKQLKEKLLTLHSKRLGVDPKNLLDPDKSFFTCYYLRQPFPDTPAFANNSPQALQLLKKLMPDTELRSVNYCTEASFLQQIGPCVVLGPGDIAQAHTVDEFIALEQLEQCVEFFLFFCSSGC